MQNLQSHASQPDAHQILDVPTDINLTDTSQQSAQNSTTGQMIIQSMVINPIFYICAFDNN